MHSVAESHIAIGSLRSIATFELGNLSFAIQESMHDDILSFSYPLYCSGRLNIWHIAICEVIKCYNIHIGATTVDVQGLISSAPMTLKHDRQTLYFIQSVPLLC